MTLYDIDRRIAEYEPEIDENTGELLNADWLDALEMERDAKIEGIALYIKELDAEAAAIKAEKDALNERQKQKEKKRESLKKYLDSALQGQKFETARCKVSYRKSQKVLIGDDFMEWAAVFNPSLIRTTIKTEPNLDAVKKLIKDGGAPVGALLVDNMTLSVK